MKREKTPLHKVTLNLYEGDFEELQNLHPELGGGKVIRELVHAHVIKVRAKLDASMPPELST